MSPDHAAEPSPQLDNLLAQCPVCLRTIWAHTVCTHGGGARPVCKETEEVDEIKEANRRNRPYRGRY
jgi:hypothetical protein